MRKGCLFTSKRMLPDLELQSFFFSLRRALTDV